LIKSQKSDLSKSQKSECTSAEKLEAQQKSVVEYFKFLKTKFLCSTKTFKKMIFTLQKSLILSYLCVILLLATLCQKFIWTNIYSKPTTVHSYAVLLLSTSVGWAKILTPEVEDLLVKFRKPQKNMIFWIVFPENLNCTFTLYQYHNYHLSCRYRIPYLHHC